MRSLRQRDSHSHSVRRWLYITLLATVCLFGGWGCTESTATNTPAKSATAGPTAQGSTTVAQIELTQDGFAPDRTQVVEGTRITLRNATDSKASVVVKGRDFGGSEGVTLDLEAGQTLDLNLRQLGAYILTLSDDPQVTASIFIS